MGRTEQKRVRTMENWGEWSEEGEWRGGMVLTLDIGGDGVDRWL